MTHLIHVIPGKESFGWTLKKKEAITYSINGIKRVLT